MLCNFCGHECTCHINAPCSFCEGHVFCEICGDPVCEDKAVDLVDKTTGETITVCPVCAEETEDEGER